MQTAVHPVDLNAPLVEIDDLHVVFDSDKRKIPAIQGVSLKIRRGRVLGLVGESGCGKSVTSLAVMSLLDQEFSETTGSIRFDGVELVGLSDRKMQKLRGNRMSMIFQEPMTSLNPVFTVCQQICEVLHIHQGMDAAQGRKVCVEMLSLVGLSDVQRLADSYPHSLSGGQRQRVMIAMALCCKPDLLIADEPTTALDVTIQAQVLDLLLDVQKKLGMAILFISHDLGVIAEMADDIAVMYAGRIVEQCSAEELYRNPLHPYTRGLMASRTDALRRQQGGDRRLPCIPGLVPAPDRLPQGCSFHPRCDKCMKRCETEMPELIDIGGHAVRCHLFDKEARADG